MRASTQAKQIISRIAIERDGLQAISESDVAEYIGHVGGGHVVGELIWADQR